MKVIAGLGNPGKKYEKTRHNVGFEAVDQLASHLQASWKQNNNSMIIETRINNEKLILIKPLTYMNLSGEAIRPLLSYYNVDAEDLLVMYDDLDLEPGRLRLRLKGGHGGHNGIRSIIDQIGTKEFKRIRIGVGRPSEGKSVVTHVLGTFPPKERSLVEKAIDLAAEAAGEWLYKPFDEVMNQFN
ncbi:aminoacyl-tRNA hydrolase [Alteribacillus iranensis]|uniref:aminoacyl-tRNA hydrolase n=1 Tax=Alteribacillus iranensis TaxID=930128 RepID=UPI000B817A84|nr:aminoacyl-tRNA hydrolase [Alteribacillus iranensis]